MGVYAFIDMSKGIGLGEFTRQAEVLDAFVQTLPHDTHVAIAGLGGVLVNYVSPKDAWNRTLVHETVESFLRGEREHIPYSDFRPIFETKYHELQQYVNTTHILILSDGVALVDGFRWRQSFLMNRDVAVDFRNTHPSTEILCFESRWKDVNSKFYRSACTHLWKSRGGSSPYDPSRFADEMFAVLDDHIL
jgi:hypothetical protein